MLEKAIEKIKSEMKQNKNPYVQVVGDFLLRQLELNPKDADKILVEDKTIMKSLDEMRKVAEKKKTGNCAVLTDQEGFEIVLKYFDIKAEPVMEVCTPPETETRTHKREAKGTDFDINLDDLLQ